MHTALIAYFFFFNDTATTEIYTLSLHDALPILVVLRVPPLLVAILASMYRYINVLIREFNAMRTAAKSRNLSGSSRWQRDRKSTRLNSSHANISYAVFCLKKKKKHSTTVRIVIY